MDLQLNKLFTVVGEATSQMPSHCGDLLFLRLPNSKILCTISYKHFHRPDRSKDTDEALYPGILVCKTFNSLVQGTDLAYDWILGDIGRR